jgi:hypothetical protein
MLSQWGVQERVASRLDRGKARVSEALAKIRKVAKEHDLEPIILGADPPPSPVLVIRLAKDGHAVAASHRELREPATDPLAPAYLDFAPWPRAKCL